MRKVVMTLAVCFILVMAVSFDAQDLHYTSGDWFSTSDTNYDGNSANSGIVWTTELHTMQGQVLTDSTKHSPWFNA
ncbi:MAG: hypothetical protein ACK5NF_07875 [Bacilli bacterium]